MNIGQKIVLKFDGRCKCRRMDVKTTAAEVALSPLFWVSVLQGVTVELRRHWAKYARKKDHYS